MRRIKHIWLARRLRRIAYTRRRNIPFTPEWLALDPLARVGVTFTPEQIALIKALP